MDKPKRPAKRKNKRGTMDESYTIEVQNWDLTYSFGLNNIPKFIPGSFIESLDLFAAAGNPILTARCVVNRRPGFGIDADVALGLKLADLRRRAPGQENKSRNWFHCALVYRPAPGGGSGT